MNDNVSIDFDGMLKQIYDVSLINIFSSFADKDEDKQTMKKMFELFYKYGVRPEDSVKLLIELFEIFNIETKGEENNE